MADGMSSTLKTLAISFVVIAILVQVVSTIRDGFTADTVEYNITNGLITGFVNAVTYAPIFVIVVLAGYVLRYMGILG